MKSSGNWAGFFARFYYVTGSVFYAYHWFLALGGVSFLASGTFIYYKAPVLTAISLTVAFYAMGLGISFWRKVGEIKLSSLNPGLRVDRVTVDYKLLGEYSAEYSRDVTATALFPVDAYYARFNWTGNGGVEGVAVKSCSKVEATEHPGSVFNACRVNFKEKLDKGSQYNFIYRLRFSDGKTAVRPFLGHTIDSSVEILTLRVHLMPTQEVKVFKRQLFISSAANLPLWEEVVHVDDPQIRLLEWVIQKPKHHFNYRIAW